MMRSTFDEKIFEIKQRFSQLKTAEERYALIMEMGRKLPPFPSPLKTADRLVPGCQSLLYLHADCSENSLNFKLHSDALISAGLGALLLFVYNGESPKTILTSPPLYIQQLGIDASLSMNRSNGLANIYLRMKQLTLPFLLNP